MLGTLNQFRFGDWLRAQLKRKGLSIRAFASALPVSAATVQTWMASAAPEIQAHNVGRLARHLGVKVQDLEWLLACAAERKSTTAMDAELSLRGLGGLDNELDVQAGARGTVEIEPITLRRIPFFDFKVPASGWAEGCEGKRAEEADGYVEVPTDAPRDAFAFRIRGDCMVPTFPDGAVVVCVPVRPGDNGQQFFPGKAYYCINNEGRCTFKNVFYEPPKERYRLESLNKKYKPFWLPEQEMSRMSRAIKVVIEL